MPERASQRSGQLRPGVRFHCFNTTKTLHNKLLLAIITSYTDQRICAFRRTRHKHVVQQEGGRHRDVRDAGQEEPEAHRRSARGDGIPPRQLEEDPSVPKIHTYVTLSCVAVSTSTTLTSLSAWHILGIAILIATVLLTLNHDAVVAVSSPRYCESLNCDVDAVPPRNSAPFQRRSVTFPPGG